MNLSQALLKSKADLEQLGQDNPGGQAERILEHILGIDRSELYRQGERELTAAQSETLRETLRRRGTFEPLQYILGRMDFHTINLKVDRRALIPRPETEGLVELVLDAIQSLPSPSILDVGTGSGAIALAILHNHPGAAMAACDISESALELARENTKCLGLESRITFIPSDLFADGFVKSVGGPFHLVVSNPPYVSEGEYRRLPEEIRNWEPPEALRSGPEGLDVIQRLAEVAGELIQEGGRIIIEIGEEQKNTASAVFQNNRWQTHVTEDLSGKPRYLTATPK